MLRTLERPDHRHIVQDSLYGRSLAHTRHLLTLRGQVVQETPSPYTLRG